MKNRFLIKMNNIYSLALAKDWLCMMIESDIIFDDSLLDTLISDSRDTLALVNINESGITDE